MKPLLSTINAYAPTPNYNKKRGGTVMKIESFFTIPNRSKQMKTAVEGTFNLIGYCWLTKNGCINFLMSTIGISAPATPRRFAIRVFNR